MTKTVLQTLIILVAGAGAYLSLSTKSDTNQGASTTLVKSLDDARIKQAAADKIASDEQTTRILSLLNRQLDSMTGILESIQQLGSQNQELAKQSHELAEQNQKQGAQILALANQLKSVQDGQSKILEEHTETLKEAKSSAAKAVVVAKENQVTTQRAIRQLHPPPGKSVFQKWFAAPSPTPRKHR